MNTAKLHIRMTFIEGALIRLIGLVGRRGFEIVSIEAHQDGTLYEIKIEVRGVRMTDTLQKQIAKMYDVKSVASIDQADASHDSIRLHADAPRAVAMM